MLKNKSGKVIEAGTKPRVMPLWPDAGQALGLSRKKSPSSPPKPTPKHGLRSKRDN